jgi:hypothetical protein
MFLSQYVRPGGWRFRPWPWQRQGASEIGLAFAITAVVKLEQGHQPIQLSAFGFSGGK